MLTLLAAFPALVSTESFPHLLDLPFATFVWATIPSLFPIACFHPFFKPHVHVNPFGVNKNGPASGFIIRHNLPPDGSTLTFGYECETEEIRPLQTFPSARSSPGRIFRT